jgi:hypothetical protein
MPLAGAAPLPGIDLPKTEFGPGPAPIVAIGIAADTISCPHICEAVTGSAFRGAIFLEVDFLSPIGRNSDGSLNSVSV